MFTILLKTDFCLSNKVVQNTTSICGQFRNISKAQDALKKRGWVTTDESELKWTRGKCFYAYIVPINRLNYLIIDDSFNKPKRQRRK